MRPQTLQEKEEFWIWQIRQKSGEFGFVSIEQEEYEFAPHRIYKDKDIALWKSYYSTLLLMNPLEVEENNIVQYGYEMGVEYLFTPSLCDIGFALGRVDFKGIDLLTYLRRKGFPIMFRIWDYGKWDKF